MFFLNVLKRKISRWLGELFLPSYYRLIYLRNKKFKDKKIYHVHIRKTGGTSLNNMFLSLGEENYEVLYDKLACKASNSLCSGDLVFVGWNKRLIESGQYFYAFSHIPYWRLKIPHDVFTFCCFRDPATRIISHYRMLLGMSQEKIKHPCFEIEGQWLGSCFRDFLENIPKEHLLNQLYMFSREFDIDEAIENVKRLDHIMITEKFNEGVVMLNAVTGLMLPNLHIRKAQVPFSLERMDASILKEMLEDEYMFLERIRFESQMPAV